MTKLSDRVQKAKKLRVSKVGSKPGEFSVVGSKGDSYIIQLSSGKKEIITPDGYLTISTFETFCTKKTLINNSLDATNSNCYGNTAHTVCYHCLGAIKRSFEEIGQTISFYENYHKALSGLNFGGYLALVVNQVGKGSVWAVVNNGKHSELKFSILPEKETLSVEENINLMRGPAGDEGIE